MTSIITCNTCLPAVSLNLRMRRCCGDRWSTHLTKDREREKERDWMAQMEDLSRDPRGRFNDASTIWRVPGGRGLNMLITPTKPRCVCVLSIKPAAPHTHLRNLIADHAQSRTDTQTERAGCVRSDIQRLITAGRFITE